MTRDEKFELLQDLTLDLYIKALQNNDVAVKDLGNIVSFLKNNKVVQERSVISEADVIDELVEKK